jgi:hypothetical protein
MDLLVNGGNAFLSAKPLFDEIIFLIFFDEINFLCLRRTSRRQGDQIRRIFAQRTIVYFEQEFLKITEVAHICSYFFRG